MTKVFIEATKLVEKTGGDLTPEQMLYEAGLDW